MANFYIYVNFAHESLCNQNLNEMKLQYYISKTDASNCKDTVIENKLQNPNKLGVDPESFLRQVGAVK